jgi:cyclophilin family peptidyl-prolyl cis-trans isomerase
MMKRVLSFLAIALTLFVVNSGAYAVETVTTPAPSLDPQNTLYMDLPFGRVVIALRPDKAPKTVARIKELARMGFYDGLTFHRVIPGFMAQGGDPKGDGTGGSGQHIPAEFNDLKHLRGTISMARSADPNSADSQFFICFAPAPFLDGKYTAFGRVVSGMQYVDMIKKGDQARNGEVQDPTHIIRMQVMADVKQ